MLTELDYKQILINSIDIKKLIQILNQQTKTGYVKKISNEKQEKIPDLSSAKLGSYKKYVEEFVYIYFKEISKYNYNALINNISSLEIVEIDNLNKEGALAKYSKNENKIYIKKGCTNESELKHKLFHELIHLSSSFKKEPIYISGFSQTILPAYGHGSTINEGATELINRRYFSIDVTEKDEYIYDRERCIAFMVEAIVGTPKFMEGYFNGDILNIVNEVAKYCDLEMSKRIFGFIELFGLEKNEAKKNIMYLNIKVMLHNIYLRKIFNRYINNEITWEQYDLFKLKSSFNLRDYNILKHPNKDYYEFHSIFSNDTYILNNDIYRILLTYFKNSLEYKNGGNKLDCIDSKLIEMIDSLYYLEDNGIDLSKVESISINDYSTKNIEINYLKEEIKFGRK